MPVNQLSDERAPRHMEIAHDSLKARRHPIGHGIPFWPWYGYWYCDRACRSQLFFRQNFLFQHAFNQAGLSSSRDIAGGSLMKLIGLGHPLKNQVSANIHGIDRISPKARGNPID